MEPDYLPCVQMSCFSHVWSPYPNRGVWGGFPSHYSYRGVEGGVAVDVRAPSGGGSGAAPPKGNFYENILVKYYDFVFNMGLSLCCLSDSRNYVNLRVFCPRRKPSIICEGIVLQWCIILRDKTVRE